MAVFFVESVIKSDKFIVKLTFFLLYAEIIKMVYFLVRRSMSQRKGESNDNRQDRYKERSYS